MAAYTCTPLVTFPLADLRPGAKVRGKTVAELGNRNTPLDMIAYEKDGKKYLLVANTSRGVMKISLENIDKSESIEERVANGGVAGLPYETIEGLEGVEQLDSLGDSHAVIATRRASGEIDVRVIDLP